MLNVFFDYLSSTEYFVNGENGKNFYNVNWTPSIQGIGFFTLSRNVMETQTQRKFVISLNSKNRFSYYKFN